MIVESIFILITPIKNKEMGINKTDRNKYQDKKQIMRLGFFKYLLSAIFNISDIVRRFSNDGIFVNS